MVNGRSTPILRGVGASPGTATGFARVLMSPADSHLMRQGDILVTPETNPQFTEALLKASALVTDRGGMLSHQAIVARELGIPGVVGTREATKKIKSGLEVIVNGDTGEVLEG